MRVLNGVIAAPCFGLFVLSSVLLPPQRLWASEPAIAPTLTTAYTQPQMTRLEIDVSSRQLTLYRGDRAVRVYPVAVGREGWQTPVGDFEVREMIHNPAWMNPFTQQVTPGGDPENPLGRYWIGFWTDGTNWVGMHGTPNPESVGRAASHGCIRLYNEDIQELFSQVQVGTPVIVVP
jgi:lipoprotein-anchoring transpeptidase ErfK/SrfK